MVNKLAHARAFSWERAFTVDSDDVSSVQALTFLQTLNVVEPDSTSSPQPKWIMTSNAAARIRSFQSVDRPRPFFCAADALTPIEDQSPWEWICTLRAAGWILDLAPKTRAARLKLPPYVPNGPKKWYASGLDLTRSKKYVLAIARSDVLFETTSVVQIHHCESKSYYVRILKGKGSGRVAIEDAPSRSALELDYEPELGGEVCDANT